MLTAAQPLYVPEPERSGAVETLTALVRARLAFRDDLLAFGAPLGFRDELLETWLKTGLAYVTTALVDNARGTTKEIVAASPKGARELAATTGVAWKASSATRIRRAGAKLVHDATVGRAALAVLAAARMGQIDLVALETDDHVLGTSAVVEDERGAPMRVPLQADAYVLVRERGTLRGLLLEIDRSTTAAARIGEKYAGFAIWQKQCGPERTFGVKAMRVLTLAPDDNRCARLAAETAAAVGRPSAMFLFATIANVSPADPEKLLEPIATNLVGTVEPVFRRA